MENVVWIKLILGHRSFFTGKIVMVSLPDRYVMLETYKNEAKQKACTKLGLRESEVAVLDYEFLGSNVTFIE